MDRIGRGYAAGRGGGGTNGVYKNNFVRTAALADSVNMHRGVLVVLCRRFVLSCIAAKKKISYERVH